MAIVHSYVRFSTPDQLQGDSLRRQAEAAAVWCKTNNHKLSDLTFHDLGKSSYRGKKQESLARFLKAIDEGQVQPGDILLCEAVDRLSRKGIRQTQDLVNSILNRGIDIAILTPIQKVYKSKDENDIGGAIELAAFAYQAHIYSQILSGRIKDWWTGARRVARETGKKIPGNAPGWIKKTESGFELDPVGAATIRHIFQRTIDGMGGNQLCAELNEKFLKLGRKGFNKTFVRSLIRSRVARGEFQPHVMNEENKRVPIGDPIPDYFPVAIDEKTWLAAQQACNNRSVERGPSGDFCNLFVGLIHHVIDDCPCHIYTYQQKRADGRKVIFRRLKSYRATCGEPGASTETFDLMEFEKLVLKTLVEVDVTKFGKKSNVSEFAVAQAELAKREKRIAELTEKLESDDSIDFLIDTIKKLKHEATTLKKSVQVLAAANSGQSASCLQERIKALRELPQTSENRQLMREAVKRVVKQFNVVMKKTGTQRKSPVSILIEIVFHDSTKTRKIFACSGVSLQLEGAQFKLNGKLMPPLHEVPRENLINWWQDLDKSDWLQIATPKVLVADESGDSFINLARKTEKRIPKSS